MPSALLVIAKQGFQDRELDGVRSALTDAGFTVTLASTEEGTCTGKFGGSEEATLALADVDVASFDRVGFIGGPGAEELKDDAEALRIARETADAEIPLGAICIAPLILANAGVLKGKKATVWDDDGEQAGYLTDHDALYTGESVTQDGLIVTGNGPDAAEEFGKVFAGM